MITIKQQKQAVELRRQGAKLMEIARVCGITWHQAQWACREVSKPYPRDDVRAHARALAAEGVRQGKIAEVLGVPTTTVGRWCRGHWPDLRAEVRRLRAQGMSSRQIGAEIGRCHSTVINWLRADQEQGIG